MPQPSPLLLRADASATIGTGHVMRALALAQAWHDLGGRALLAAAEIPHALGRRLTAEGVGLMVLEAAPGSAADAEATAALARRVGATWVVADGYHFDRSWQSHVRGSGLALACVDDDARIGGYDAEIVIDQNHGVGESRYAAAARGARLLLGPHHALLRREFRRCAPPSRRHRGAGRPSHRTRVLVTFGGSDPARLSERALVALARSASPALEVRVVAGAANDRLRELRAIAAEQSGPHAFTVMEGVTDMPALMAWADLAVSAAGSTCWELAYMGLPMVLVEAAENQRVIANGLAAEGAAHSLGEAASLDDDELASSVGALARAPAQRAAMAERGRALVDGRGAERVASALTLEPALEA